ETQAQVKAASDTAAHYRELCGPALETIVGRKLDDVGTINWKATAKDNLADRFEIGGVLTNPGRHEELPVIFLYPRNWNGRAILWLGDEGKSVLYGKDGLVRPEAKKLVDEGNTVVGVDLFSQGEFLGVGEKGERNRTVENPREFAGYTYGYNHTLAAQRVHDVLTVVRYLQNHDRKPKEIAALALDNTASILLAARAIAPEAFGRVAIDTHGFRFGHLLDWRDARFLPGAAKYGDLPGMIALAPKAPLLVASESKSSLELPLAFYRDAKPGLGLEIYTGKSSAFSDAALSWLRK
ncbi:MAG TPA: acetylxylan esterase, partial [Candidatus Limnocylindria bacterium]|nr:acetylxylan esterase [Candidatus Limnocylindria bacterium]